MTPDTQARRTIAVGVTGASGAIYAVRTIAALLELGCHLEIIFSDYGAPAAHGRARAGGEDRIGWPSSSRAGTATAFARARS